MKRVCAWCQKPLNNEPEGGVPVSHGICDRCFQNTVVKIALLDSLSVGGPFLEEDRARSLGKPFTNPR